jgi:hypothetical protein
VCGEVLLLDISTKRENTILLGASSPQEIANESQKDNHMAAGNQKSK